MTEQRMGQADPLHPNGRCTCCGEGRCDWCLRTELRQAKMKIGKLRKRLNKVRAEEREACAKACETWANEERDGVLVCDPIQARAGLLLAGRIRQRATKAVSR